MKKAIAFTLTLLIILSCTACGESIEKSNFTLINSVTVYSVDQETGDFTDWSKTEFTYENCYPKSIKTEYPDSDYETVKTFEYSFKNGLPVAMTQYEDGVEKASAEYVNGRLSQISFKYDFEPSTKYLTYIYGNDDDFFTMVLHSQHMGDPSDPSAPFYNAEEIDEVSVTTKNGVLLKTVNHGLYTNWVDGEDREWLRFNGTYTGNYNSDGILTSTSTQYRDDQTPMDYLFEITKENGRVTEVIRKTKTPESSEGEIDAKIVFEYSDIQIDAVRYSSMINAYIMEDGNCFYIYNWY